MRRLLLLMTLLLGLGASLPVSVPAQAQTTVRTGSLTLTSVTDWQQGTSDGLLVSNNEGGELRLSEERSSGEFVSAPLEVRDASGGFFANAVGASWQADIIDGTLLLLEVRGGLSPEGPWGEWQPLTAGDARAQRQALASESLRVLPPETAFLQVRATFTSEVQRASATLSTLTLYAFDSLAGPASALGFDAAPIAYGSDVLTPRPSLVLRTVWDEPEPGPSKETAPPRQIVLHQTGSLGGEALETTGQPLMILRALAAYQRKALGWGDLVYHYVIDREGNLYEGRRNGPTNLVPQFGSGDPAVHIALLSDFAEEPTPEARATLAGLVAWLGQVYAVPPLGEHRLRLDDGSETTRLNYVAHSELSPAAADPGPVLRDLMPELRAEADRATVRTRFFFPEGNTLDYEQRMALFNPGSVATTARVVLLRQPGPPILQEVPLEPGARTDLTINTIFNDTTDVPAIIEANQQIVAERVMRRTATVSESEVSEVDGNVGLRDLSRVWYFAEGSTDGGFETYLLLLNPQTAAANATLTYMLGDGRVISQSVVVPPRARAVVRAADTVANVGFGTRVLADRPIAVERTMLFGDGLIGFHTAPGQQVLARRWLFAEGTTQSPFEMRILLLNPSQQPAQAELTFATSDGTSLRRNYALPPTSRLVVNVNDVVPDLGVATQVSANRPIIAERALYFNGGNAGTVSVGVIDPAYVWRFAEGRTSDGDQMFVLINNPGRGQARVSAEFVLANGTVERQSFVMAGGSRYTLAVHDLYPGQAAIATTVRSSQPVVVERSLFRLGGRAGGYTTLGLPSRE